MRLLLAVGVGLLLVGAGPALGLQLSPWQTAGLVALGLLLLVTGLV